MQQVGDEVDQAVRPAPLASVDARGEVDVVQLRVDPGTDLAARRWRTLGGPVGQGDGGQAELVDQAVDRRADLVDVHDRPDLPGAALLPGSRSLRRPRAILEPVALADRRGRGRLVHQPFGLDLDPDAFVLQLLQLARRQQRGV